MKLISLKRYSTSDDGTRGIMIAPQFTCCTMELPWRDNKPDVSCIPNGLFFCSPHVSPTFGECYAVNDVQGRSEILIHPLNFAGDVAKGKRSESEGCIGVGLYHDVLRGQLAVLKSRVAFDRLMQYIGKNEFMLSIENLYELKEES